MTTACGSTTSKQDTPKTVSLEEAPFSEYLKVLRKEGYEDDADVSEQFYIEMLTEFGYTKEQIMRTSFDRLCQAVELIMAQGQQEVSSFLQPISVSGTMVAGEGADKLSPESLQKLMQRQMQIVEEEKLRLSM